MLKDTDVFKLVNHSWRVDIKHCSIGHLWSPAHVLLSWCKFFFFLFLFVDWRFALFLISKRVSWGFRSTEAFLCSKGTDGLDPTHSSPISSTSPLPVLIWFFYIFLLPLLLLFLTHSWISPPAYCFSSLRSQALQLCLLPFSQPSPFAPSPYLMCTSHRPPTKVMAQVSLQVYDGMWLFLNLSC